MDNNENLEDLFLSFSYKIVELLLENSPDGLTPRSRYKKIQFTSNDWGEEVVEEVLSPLSAIYDLKFVEISKLIEVEMCVKAHIKAGILKKLKNMTDNNSKLIPDPSYEQYGSYIVMEMCFPLHSVLLKKKKIQATKRQLINAYKLYCKYWQDSVNHNLMKVPVHNLEGNFDRFKFDKSMSIETLSNENKSKMFTLTSDTFFDEAPTGHDIHNCSYYLSWKFTAPRESRKYNKEGSIGLMMSAFRLYKTGDIGGKFAYIESLDPQSSFSYNGFRSGGSPLSEMWIPSHGKKYQIEKNELPHIFKIFSNLQKLEKNNKLNELNVALRRFNQVYSRRLPEDKIIDLTIALESILLAGDRTELQFRLITRGALLLKKTSDPMRTRETLKLLYRLRSNIVHGGLLLSPPNEKNIKLIRAYNSELDPQDIPTVCEYTVRAIILEYMDRLKKIDSVKEIKNLIDIEMIET
jgi:hypothetical protein